ncbi:MAG: hypothetical protein GY909_08595 [Oligoflexia bacterium]|nr:hypothetical protein [Oligoflexia bacterium]
MKLLYFSLFFFLSTKIFGFDYIAPTGHCDKRNFQEFYQTLYSQESNLKEEIFQSKDYKNYFNQLIEDNCRVLKLRREFINFNFPRICKKKEIKTTCIQRIHNELISKSPLTLDAIDLLHLLQLSIIKNQDFDPREDVNIQLFQMKNMFKAALLTFKHFEKRYKIERFFPKAKVLSHSEITKEMIQFYKKKENLHKKYPKDDSISIKDVFLKEAMLNNEFAMNSKLAIYSDEFIKEINVYKLKNKDFPKIDIFLQAFKHHSQLAKKKVKELKDLDLIKFPQY